MHTPAPRSASAIAVAAPAPVAEPVTNPTRPCKSIIASSLVGIGAASTARVE